MGERFKTKLCVLYEKGHCPRHSCSFAHGHTQLRNSGQTDYRGGDLREKLERRRSPLRRYSPRRDARDRHASHGDSPSESREQRSSDRKRHKKQHFDGQSDHSGSVKVLDHTEDRIGNIKLRPSESKGATYEQLRQAQAEIDALNNHKSQLKINLKKRLQEVDSLSMRIEELDNQLFQEKEESKRITSKISKFITAHKQHSRLQDELKRSYDLLQEMGDQLTSESTGFGVDEDVTNINILTDGETNGGVKGTIRMEKHSFWSEQHAQFDNREEADPKDRGSNGHKLLLNGIKSKRGKTDLTKSDSEQKLRGRDTGFSLPLTSMAAHAIDEGIETADQENENLEATKTTSTGIDEGATNGILRFPFPLPPPPPLPQNACAQYQGEDENFNLVSPEDDILDVDIV